MIHNNTIKQNRVLSNGHQLLNHLGHLREKIGPVTLQHGTPIDASICMMCRGSSEVKKYNLPQ
jgi:hypothetical protein